MMFYRTLSYDVWSFPEPKERQYNLASKLILLADIRCHDYVRPMMAIFVYFDT